MMKAIFLALAVLTAGASAGSLPKSAEARFVDGIIISAIEDATQSIQDLGLDPLNIDSQSVQYTLPVTDLLFAEALIENFYLEGISNILINDMNFSILATRLRFDVSLPSIKSRLGGASAKVVLGNWETAAEASGLFEIEQIRVRGEVRVSIGLGGVSIRDLSINFSVGDIKSELNVVIFGNDISDSLNSILGEAIPGFLNEFEADINELISYVVESILENVLG